MEDNNNSLQQDETNVEQTPVSKKSKNSKKNQNKKEKGLLDYNLSYIVLLFLVGFIALYAFLNVNFIYRAYGVTDTSSNVTIWLNVASLFVGLIFSFLFYNGGKLIGAYLGGYKVQVIEIFGLTWTKKNEKFEFSFKLAQILDFHLKFKANDIEKSKPAFLFFFGHILNLVAIGLLVLIGIFTSKSGVASHNESITYFGAIFVASSLFATLIPIYELFPIKSDSDPDCYAFIRTLGEDNRKAFNLLTIEQAKRVNNEDYIMPEFENYDSYYKAQVLVYKYLLHFYNEEFDQAIKVLNQIDYLSIYLTLDEQYFINGEKIYMYLISNKEKAANKNYFLLKRENRKSLTLPNSLPEYKAALLITGLIVNDEELIMDVVDNFNKIDLHLSIKSNVIEHKLFTKSYQLVKKAHPDMPLEPIRELDSEYVEKSENNSDDEVSNNLNLD